MTLSKKDKEDVASIVAQTLKGLNTPIVTTEADLNKPDLKPFSDRNKIIEDLTIKERVTIWEDIEEDNLFKQRYKAGKTLFDVKGIDGKPSLPYAIAYEHFILPICKDSRKMTKKQLAGIKTKAIKQLKVKADGQSHPKAQEWINKAIEHINGL